MRKPIYLDYNATTPHAPEVVAAMLPFLRVHFGNPSSAHLYGQKAREAVEKARDQVAGLLGAAPDEVVFTSGGTESNNSAIKGAAWAARGRRNQIVTSAIEHPSVLEVCAWLEGQGFEVVHLPVDGTGLVASRDLRKVISSRTLLVTIMHANNEVGTIQPIRELAEIAHSHGALIHTDAAQSVGKIPVDVHDLGVDLLTVAGHKLYAPKGVGALFLRRGVPLDRFMHGASHEQGRRAGTENVPGIVGLGRACEIAAHSLKANAAHMRRLTQRLFEELRRCLPEVRLNGHPTLRLPNTLNVSFPGVASDDLIRTLKAAVAVSAGSACHAGSSGVSPVLQAMNVPLEWAVGAVRFSTGRMTTEDEIKLAAEKIAAALRRTRGNREKESE